MTNRKQRRAQAAQIRAADRRDDENVTPDLCVCCNARKVMQHLVIRDKPIRAGDGQLVAYQRDDHAIADFGVLRLDMDLNSARCEIYALGESVAWFDPDHFEADRSLQPWVYTLWANPSANSISSSDRRTLAVMPCTGNASRTARVCGRARRGASE